MSREERGQTPLNEVIQSCVNEYVQNHVTREVFEKMHSSQLLSWDWYDLDAISRLKYMTMEDWFGPM